MFSRQSARNKQKLSRNNQMYLSRTRTNQQIMSLIQESSVFPKDLQQILNQQDIHIKKFKQRMDEQKRRMDSDLDSLKHDILTIIDDVKLTLGGQLNQIYMLLLQKFKNLKGEVLNLVRLKKEMYQQIQKGQVQNESVKNNKLLKEIHQLENFQQKKKMGFLIEEQEARKFQVIHQLNSDIFQLITRQEGFYYHNKASIKFQTIKQLIRNQIGQVFTNSQQFVYDFNKLHQNYTNIPQSIINRKENVFRQSPQRSQYPMERFAPHLVSNRNQNNLYQNAQHNLKKFTPTQQYIQPRNVIKSKQNKPIHLQRSQLIRIQNRSNTYEITQQQKKQYSQNSKRQQLPQRQKQGIPHRAISQNNIVCQRQVVLGNPRTIYTAHKQPIVCLCAINQFMIATGSRDSTISIWDIRDSSCYATLTGHKQSICSLTMVKDQNKRYLVSGGDRGCGTVILWDLQKKVPRQIYKAHQGSVTSILDMGDKHTFISGSYDKSIKVFRHSTNTLLGSINHQDCKINSMILSKDRQNLLSLSLDSNIYVWTVSYTNNQLGNVVQNIFLYKIIQTSQLVYSLAVLYLRQYIVIAGTKDGKLKFWNYKTAQLEKTLSVNNSGIVEILVWEKQSKPMWPEIITCSIKDKNMVATKSDTGYNSLIQLYDKLFIQFGILLKQKISFVQGQQPKIALINQRAQNGEFTIMQIR